MTPRTAASPSASATGSSPTALNIYVGTIIALGLGALAVAVARTGITDAIGDHPSLYWVFLALFFVAESRPLAWLRRHEGGELTASWTFAFALVFVSPASGTLLGVFGACMLSDLLHRKPVVKALFNAAQVSLSLGVGAVVMEVLDERDALTDAASPGLGWFLAFLVMSVVTLTLNSAFTSAVLGLVQRLPTWRMIRSGLTRNVATDGMLVALAPIIVVVALRSLLFVPLLVVTAWAVYRSAQLGLDRQHDATHDRLTELPNRRLFDEQAAAARNAARKRGHGLAVIMVDLNRFKQINDHLGQHVGDLCLQEVANRFQEAKRPSDLVARIVGDKFAVVVTAVDDPEVPVQVARTLLASLDQPCVIEGVPVAVSGSFGVATYPDDGDDVDTLVQRAELAVYAAKQRATGIATYEPAEDQRSRGRWNLISGLPEAMRKHQLVLHYQPKLDCRTGALLGSEALVRWQHPELGLVPPNRFMPFAENTEFIQPLTEHILRLALTQCAAWADAGMAMRVGVNASTRNLHDLRFPNMVGALLAESGLTADALELEITENTVMADPQRSLAVLRALRDQGIRISVDDFGTGYSSLAHLRELPIDCVKIDQSFITDMAKSSGDLAIARAIIDLAGNLGLETVAEGIETIEAWKLLRRLGCDSGQGYLISRPMPGGDFAGWVARHDPCSWVVPGDDDPRVILLVAFLALVATVPLFGGKLRNLAELELHRTSLLLVTTVLQAVITQITTDETTGIAAAVHVLSYLIVGAFVWANRTIPWLWLAALGGALNFAAIVANGGTMPATPEAARAAGMEQESGFANSDVVDDANLWFLGDVFAIPESWPLSNVFSVGDVVLLVGGALVVHDVAGPRLTGRHGGRRHDDEVPDGEAPEGGPPAGAGDGAPGGHAHAEATGAPDAGVGAGGTGAGGATGSSRVPLLRDNHDFRRLWLAGASSDLGDWTHSLAVIAILAGRGASTGVFAALLIVQMVSSSAVGLFGTPIVDRVDRMRLLGLTNLAQAVAVGSLLVPDRPGIPHFLVVGALLGGLAALVRPATMASIPNLVRPDQLVAANGFVAAAFNVAVSLGPILGAGLVARWGARSAFTVNVASFLLSAALVARVTRRGAPAPGTGAHTAPAREAWLASAMAGLRHIGRVAPLRNLVIMLVLVVLGSAVRGPIEPGFIVDTLDGSPGAIGALAGLWGLGMVLGSTVAVTAGRRWSLERVLVGGIGLLGLSIVVASQSGALTVVAVLWLLAGTGNALGSVAYETLLQQHTSDDLRGRVFGVADAVLDATYLLGALAAVAVGATVGARTGIAIGGAGAVLAAAYGSVILVRRHGEHSGELRPPAAEVPAHTLSSPVVPHLRGPDATGGPL